MESENTKRKRDSSADDKSDSSCTVVPSFLVNAGHTLTESPEELSDHETVRQKKLFKRRKVKKSEEQHESSDSSVEIIDVKLPNQADIDAQLAKDTQDLDTQDMWERLCWKEELKNEQNAKDSK